MLHWKPKFSAVTLVLTILVSFAWTSAASRKMRTSGPPSKQLACNGKGPVAFSAPPRRMKDITYIEPMGKMTGHHITPVDHGYFIPPGKNTGPLEKIPSKLYDVLAPADGNITSIGLVGGRENDFRMVIHHSCTFYTIYIHLRELPKKIIGAAGNISKNPRLRIPVKAGEVIGRASTLDFSVHNEEIVLPGFVYPEHYSREDWKIHTDDMFKYFVEPIKTRLLKKNLRTVEPRRGKIDYDVKGTMAGNWFVKNSNWYGGLGENYSNYFITHLTLGYDAIDPSLIIISTGDYKDGQAGQFAVYLNSPDPAKVTVADGLIKYELTRYDYLDEKDVYWNRTDFAKGLRAVGSNEVEGVALAQLTDEETLRFEVFPGKTAAEIKGFTSAAKIYER